MIILFERPGTLVPPKGLPASILEEDVDAGLLTDDPYAIADVEERAALSELNRYRTSKGLSALELHSLISRSAGQHAYDMGKRGYFAHTSPEGSTPRSRLQAVGYSLPAGVMVLENCAAGYWYMTGRAVMAAWRASAGHNANLLRPELRRVGLARVIVPGSRYWCYWVMVGVSA